MPHIIISMYKKLSIGKYTREKPTEQSLST